MGKLHAVSCKAAIFSPDYTQVLLMKHPSLGGRYGLPGGHLEANETPLQAMRREIAEEIGIDPTSLNLQRKDFWLHGDDGKVILGFVAITADLSLPVAHINPDGDVYAVWIAVADVEGLPLDRGYIEFIRVYQEPKAARSANQSRR